MADPLPQDFNAGPFASDAEFNQFKADQAFDAQQGGFDVTVKRVEQNGQIFAQVTYQAKAG